MRLPKLNQTGGKIANAFVLILACIGVVHIISGMFDILFKSALTLVIIAIGGFGVVMLFNIAARKDFRSPDTILALVIIGISIALFYFMPHIVPMNMSLM